jgi:hypothetical protein
MEECGFLAKKTQLGFRSTFTQTTNPINHASMSIRNMDKNQNAGANLPLISSRKAATEASTPNDAMAFPSDFIIGA